MSWFHARIGNTVGFQTCALTLMLCAALPLTGCSKTDGNPSVESSPDTTDAQDDPAATSEPTTEVAASASDRMQRLTDAAMRVWEARVAEDWAVVFEYQRLVGDEQYDVEQYIAWSKQNEPFVIHSYQFEDISIENDIGWVTLKCESTIRQFPNAAPKTTARIEKWQLIDDKWKIVPPQEYDLHNESPYVRDIDAENVLRERFEESWQARLESDWTGLYQMSDPKDHADIAEHELAEAKDLTIYIDREIHWIQVIGDYGIVRVAITHKINDPNLTKLPARIIMKDEQWVRRDGTWYLDLRPEGAN